MSRRVLSFGTLVLAAALLLAACAPAAPSRDGGSAPGPAPSAPKALTIALEDEPLNLPTLLAGGSSSAGEIRHVVHQRLAAYDERGAAGPQLATALPTQEAGTWVVRPDGSMQTTYRIHRNVTWHDGMPLTVRDFTLAYTMTLDPELPVSQQSVARQISRIDTPDDWTLVIEWNNTNPFANAIVEDDLGPFAAHILQPIYANEKERVPQLPYWTREFVGVGPYRLVEWQPGSHLVLRAYEQFFGGRPRIDTLTFRFIDNPATVLANLLAGTVDGAGPSAIDYSVATTVKEDWERAGKKPVFVAQSANWRRLGVQFRVTQPTELRDARARQAFYSAIDRQGLVDTLFGGYAPASDTFVPPDDVKWDWVKDAIVRHEYNPRRAQELLTAVGWRRGPDGSFLTASGERASVNLWATAGVENEIAIIADSWKNLGVNVEQLVLSRAQNQDDQFRVSYPSFSVATFPASFEFTVRVLHSSGCPSEQTRWRGNNRGCYQNVENDRLIEALSVAINPVEQQRLYRDLVRLRTEELPELPLYFVANFTVFRDGVTGVKGIARPRGGLGWNVMDWDVRS